MKPEAPDPLDPEQWRACGDYLYGVDLFNHGYYWEAHEVWEGLWNACGRRGLTATFVKALIGMAAAGFKLRLGNTRGAKAHAARAAELFRATAAANRADAVGYMGVDLRMVEHWARDIANQPPIAPANGINAGTAVFEFLLWPGS